MLEPTQKELQTERKHRLGIGNGNELGADWTRGVRGLRMTETFDG